MSKKYVPVYNLNVPNGGMQGPPLTVPSDKPVHSSYTGELIGYGPIPRGMMSDAPIGHPNHGKDFHVIEYNPCNESWMMHYAHKSISQNSGSQNSGSQNSGSQNSGSQNSGSQNSGSHRPGSFC
ncbi:hypothetical protein QLL95_gp0360 [Cotonvirus japonicus]|uniref:Uncharacterized protein n=1 Tax=Cotonvirus japonicus TaxID=2811091 RepID=A0ABM7NQQ0_9VIRU|nr:hypothetical protein QLL95_gp0003 [Cotonvirus japonicus]YP_010842371.1 hypothetical protein QLL95_gp0360 [Cotonvirus japonicus]BCS82492.1 hypothetical protein [Cotonvirus japonicus]BCS83763.1 hypothetical protein [Cotonvirus japonicus]